MKNNNIIICILLISILCIGCGGKKKNDAEQTIEKVRFHVIEEKDFSFWDGLVVDSDFTRGPNGNLDKLWDAISTAEEASMVGEALIRSALNGKYVEEIPKIVIDKRKYWVVQGISGNNQDKAMCLYVAVIQKSNGTVLDFRTMEK